MKTQWAFGFVLLLRMAGTLCLLPCLTYGTLDSSSVWLSLRSRNVGKEMRLVRAKPAIASPEEGSTAPQRCATAQMVVALPSNRAGGSFSSVVVRSAAKLISA